MPNIPSSHRWGRTFELAKELSKLRRAATPKETLACLQRISQSADLLDDFTINKLVDEYLVSSSDPRHRGEVCYLLGLSGRAAYRDRLRACTNDKYAWVRKQASEALRRLAKRAKPHSRQPRGKATVYRVFVASPSDVEGERKAVHEVIEIWNATHSGALGVVLLPKGWDTDAVPLMNGDEPQKLINQLVDESQILVAFFWTRLGTPTRDAECGTAEEIKRFMDSGRPALLYFSLCPLSPNQVDPEQFKRLLKFKKECILRGLYSEYRSVYEFRELLQRHLCQVVYALRHKSGKL